MKSLICSIAFALAAGVSASWAASIQTKQVQFRKGESAATIKGDLKGEQIVDYKLRARAGQNMRVTLNTSSTSAYFNVLPPASESALFVGSTSGNAWSGALPADGEYTIRVYLVRAAARRNESAHYVLTVGITGSAKPAASAGEDQGADVSMRAGMGKFDASGRIPCAQHKDQPMGQCDFGVVRAKPGSGTATVVVTRPDGRKRAIFFEKGKAIGADLSQADSNMDFRARKESDLNFIQAGDERYEIPDAVITGG